MKRLFCRFFYCVALATLLAASPAHAAAPLLIGATVSGMGVSTGPSGILATTTDLLTTAEYTILCIDTAIVEAASQIVTALKGQTEAMKVMSRGMLETIVEAMKQKSMAELKTDLERQVSTNAQAENSCHARDGAAAYTIGRKAEGGYRQAIHLKNAEMADGKLDTDLDVILANFEKMQILADESVSGELMFPANGLVPDEDIKKANELIRQNINPHPTPQLEDAMASTPAAKDAAFSQQVKQSRLAVAEDTLNAISAAHSPLLDAGDVLLALKLSIGAGTTDVPQNDVGRTSIMSYLDVWSQSRFGSPNWYQGLFQAVDPIKLEREMAFMQAMQVEISRRSLEFQMRNAHMLASILGIMVEKTHNPVVLGTLEPARVEENAKLKE